MVEVSNILDTFFGWISTVTTGLRGFIGTSFPEFGYIIILGLSIIGGYYLNKKFPNIIEKYGVVWVSLIIYLLLRYV